MPPLSVLEQVGGGSIIEDRDFKTLGPDEVVDELVRIQDDHFPDLPLYEIVRLFFQHPKELCITGITDPWTNWVIGMEASCKKYGTLPYVGAWLDQPMWVIDVFDEIAITTNLFERKRQKELEGKRE